MITIPTMIAILAKYGTSIFGFLKKHWKQLLVGGLLFWVVVCCVSHCRYVSPWDRHVGRTDTVSIKVDTVWVLPDTNAIFALHGFDTLPKYVRELENRKRFKPKAPVFPLHADDHDSISALVAYGELLKGTLIECDSLYGDAVALRAYSDTLRNDSIELSVGFNVSGKLVGEPKIDYRYLAPYPVITKTITTETVLAQPRKVYVGAAIGPRLPWESDRLDAIVGSAEAGYTDRRDNSFGLQGDFSQKDYTVKFAYRKSFGVGK